MRNIPMPNPRAALSLFLIASLCPAQGPVDFEAQIQPIFAQHCTKCHGVTKRKGGLRLDSYQAGWTKGKHPIIAPGKPGASELIEYVKLPLDDPDHMPPKQKLAKSEIELLSRWIQSGAQGPSKKTVSFRDHIEPILKSSCVSCHGAKRQKGGLRLDRFDVSLTEGEHPALVRGEPLNSEIFKRISLAADDPDVMPNNGKLLKAKQVALIKTWIAEGAVWPVDKSHAQPDAEMLWQKRFDMGVISARQKQVISRALVAVTEAGGVGGPVAQTSDAIDINFSLAGKRVGTSQLKSLSGLEPVLVWLNLARTGIDDQAADLIQFHGKLQRLDVSRTAIGDLFVNQISGLAELTVLNLYGTQVSDEAITALSHLESLERLYLWDSKVTADGASKLRKALPKCRIDIGEHRVVSPRKVLAPINTQCPVMGKPVNAQFAVTHQGKRIAFCCGKCMAAFVKNPAKFEAKLKLKSPSKATQAKPKATTNKQAQDLETSLPTNSRCPVSGSPVNKDHWAIHKGTKVGFCCAKCKATFAKAPGKFEGKLKD